MRKTNASTRGEVMKPMELTYDFATKTAKLVIPEEHEIDEDGAVAFFQHIDPEVQVINVWDNFGQLLLHCTRWSDEKNWVSVNWAEMNEVAL